jgi:hypothetical protein
MRGRPPGAGVGAAEGQGTWLCSCEHIRHGPDNTQPTKKAITIANCWEHLEEPSRSIGSGEWHTRATQHTPHTPTHTHMHDNAEADSHRRPSRNRACCRPDPGEAEWEPAAHKQRGVVFVFMGGSPDYPPINIYRWCESIWL